MLSCIINAQSKEPDFVILGAENRDKNLPIKILNLANNTQKDWEGYFVRVYKTLKQNYNSKKEDQRKEQYDLKNEDQRLKAAFYWSKEWNEKDWPKYFAGVYEKLNEARTQNLEDRDPKLELAYQLTKEWYNTLHKSIS